MSRNDLETAVEQSLFALTEIAVHTSRQDWEPSRDIILLPRLSHGVEGGFTIPPEDTAFDVVNQMTA